MPLQRTSGTENPESQKSPASEDDPITPANLRTERPIDSPTDTTTDQNDPDLASTEYGGVTGPEPTRYGDWEKNGRCVDF